MSGANLIGADNAQPRVVLLLTPVDLTRESAGQLYLAALTSTVSHIRVISSRLPDGGYLEFTPSASAVSRAAASVVARLGFWQTMKLASYEKRKMPLDFRLALELLRKHNADSIWITLSSPASILLAYALIQAGIKVRATVWDAPEHLLASQRIYRNVSDRVMQCFADVLRRAEKVSVISTNMQMRYRDLFEVEAVVLRPIATEPKENPRSGRRRGTLRLLFAGSLYAKDEWNALVRTLQELCWRINGRRVVLYYVGAFPLRGVVADRHVRRLGHRTSTDTMAIARRCDAAYLPYWLSGKSALVAATSFPSKLATYLSCGLPVLNHSPRTSETTRIMADHPIGASCDSLSGNDLRTALLILAGLTESEFTQIAIRGLVHSELSPELIGKRFTEFLQ